MNNNSRIGKSNPASKGGLGIHYEERVDVYFLLALLIEGYSPVQNEKIFKLNFQSESHRTDDLVVFTKGDDGDGRLLCQMKHSVRVSESNKDFKKTIIAAWEDYNASKFKIGRDHIVLICESISVDSKTSLLSLHHKSMGLVNGIQFADTLRYTSHFSNHDRNVADVIKNIINKKFNVEIDDTDLYGFFRSFTILQIDIGDPRSSFYYPLVLTLISDHSTQDPQLVLSYLYSYVSVCNQNGDYITYDDVPIRIRKLFDKDRQYNIQISEPVPETDDFIVTLALIGGWDESNEYDRNTIQHIFGYDFSKFQNKAKTFAIQHPDYITNVEDKWLLNDSESFLSQCKTALFTKNIEKVIFCLKQILHQKNRWLNSKYSYISGDSSKYDNSNLLRKNLLKNLCWVKLHLNELKNCSEDKIVQSIDELISDLLSDADLLTLSSLSDCACELAQLSPDVFCETLEDCIIKRKDEAIKFLTSSFSYEYIRVLLTIAWIPEYLADAVLVLGQLEALPYDRSNCGNKPLDAIVSIFLAWCPQTFASSEVKLRVLSSLKLDCPDVYWKVIYNLLPYVVNSVSNHSKPQYISIEDYSEHDITQNEANEQYNIYLELAVNNAKKDITKLTSLVKFIKYMPDITLNTYLDYLDELQYTPDNKNFNELWLKLFFICNLLKKDGSKITEKYMDRITAITKKFEPEDIVMNYQKYYLGYTFSDFDNYQELENRKTAAIREIYEKYGIDKVAEYASNVKQLTDVPRKLGTTFSKDELSEMIDLFSCSKLESEFFYSCLKGYLSNHSPDNLLHTCFVTKEQEFILNVLTEISYSKEMYDVIQQLGCNETEYWKKVKYIGPIVDESNEEICLIVSHLINADRSIKAVNLVGLSGKYKELESDIIVKLLISAYRSNDTELRNEIAFCNLIRFIQEQDNVSLDIKCQIELMYISYLEIGMYEVRPVALYSRIAENPEYFCRMIEMVYSNTRKDEIQDYDYNIRNVLYDFQVVPGMSKDGKFNQDEFSEWMNYVKNYAFEKDLRTIAMHKIGNALTFAIKDVNNLPDKAVLIELNSADNKELREGYELGLVNHIGAVSLTPEGKDQMEISHKFETCAIETKDLPRVTKLYEKLAKQFKKEAKTDYKRFVLKTDI